MNNNFVQTIENHLTPIKNKIIMRETQINKKQPEKKSNWRSIPYSANK